MDSTNRNIGGPSFRVGFHTVVQHRQFHLLITCRHIRDLIDQFQQHPKIRIKANKEDLRHTSTRSSTKEEYMTSPDQDFANRLVQKLTQSAEGMYVFYRSISAFAHLLGDANLLKNVFYV